MMRSGSNEDDIFGFLRFGMNFYDIACEMRPWECFVTDKQCVVFETHFHDLIIDSGIVKIATQKKEKQHGSDDIIAEDR